MPKRQKIADLPLEELDGCSAKTLFSLANSNGKGYTFDDMILLPGHIDFGVHDVSLTTNLTKKITLKYPLASTPMDTVTEHKMAIAMALEGGIGFIHNNMSIEQQVQEVLKVKRFESGFIVDPVCLKPTDTIQAVDRISKAQGFSAMPITKDGKAGSKLLGLVTTRDIDFLEDRTLQVCMMWRAVVKKFRFYLTLHFS